MATARPSTAPIPVATRIDRFTYAIRNIVVEAQKVEASGRRVRYLNIGDPNAFGFKTPAHLITAVERALHDGHNGYGPSSGIQSGREAVAAEYTGKGFPVTPDRAFLTAGTSEGIEFALGAPPMKAARCCFRCRPTRCTAVLTKLGARPVFYRTDPARVGARISTTCAA
jgi:alanine-synthesizing transaminase